MDARLAVWGLWIAGDPMTYPKRAVMIHFQLIVVMQECGASVTRSSKFSKRIQK